MGNSASEVNGPLWTKGDNVQEYTKSVQVAISFILSTLFRISKGEDHSILCQHGINWRGFVFFSKISPTPIRRTKKAKEWGPKWCWVEREVRFYYGKHLVASVTVTSFKEDDGRHEKSKHPWGTSGMSYFKDADGINEPTGKIDWKP